MPSTRAAGRRGGGGGGHGKVGDRVRRGWGAVKERGRIVGVHGIEICISEEDRAAIGRRNVGAAGRWRENIFIGSRIYSSWRGLECCEGHRWEPSNTSGDLPSSVISATHYLITDHSPHRRGIQFSDVDGHATGAAVASRQPHGGAFHAKPKCFDMDAVSFALNAVHHLQPLGTSGRGRQRIPSAALSCSANIQVCDSEAHVGIPAASFTCRTSDGRRFP